MVAAMIEPKEMKLPLKSMVPDVEPLTAGRPKSKITRPWVPARPAALPWALRVAGSTLTS